MIDGIDRLMNQSAKKLALMAERLRATPHLCFQSEPIAVIAIGCRFPGAEDHEQFRQMLLSGKHAITEIPPDRWDVDACYDADPQVPGKTYSRWGGFLERVDEFDAAFFGISPREARHMDPRQRILLETAWEALANAGLPPESLSGSNTGVFIGHMIGDYYSLETAHTSGIDSYVGTGNLDSILANRLSYVLNLQGPSLAVDTACSSSLVALYLACQSLRLDECQSAIVGGINLMLTPEMHVMGAKSLLLSPDGRCKTFDRGANGFVRGEGCGVLVLKRLADALTANDHVLAVIRGIAVNQDGRTNGISAPNGLSQQRVIRRALQNALLDASQVTFVETHGTGTVVGDAIELETLAEIYGMPSEVGPCYLGAVKTNLGHLEGAAGAAGVIKMILCLQHGFIPPNLNFRELNPHISLGHTRLRLPDAVEPWRVNEGPRRGAVSSFGLGGTNGHVILEEAPQTTARVVAVNRPVRPFNRRRFWLQDRGSVPRDAANDLFYRLEWQIEKSENPNPTMDGGDWLIVGPVGARSENLAELLRRNGKRVATSQNYRAGPYDGVVFLANATEGSDPPSEAESASIALLHLIQAMAREESGARLWLITRGSQAVTRNESVQPAQAALWGLARTLRMEHPEFHCVSIDLDPNTYDLNPLTADLLTLTSSQVAYRDGSRYVARLARARISKQIAPTIHATGSYLITGGLGALGLRIAASLVEEGARQLVLAGRSLRDDEPAVAELREAGASVHLVRADITRREDVSRLIATCQANGPLRGVVHAAGVVDDGILENQTADRFARVMAPKTRGGWELHVQTQSLPLDFFVYFSSMASLLGSAGQGNYAAANAFLDALAHQRRARGLAGLSINWGPWAEVGMAADLHSRMRAHGENMIDPTFGIDMFMRALAQAESQLAVMDIDWARYAMTYPSPDFLSILFDPSIALRASTDIGVDILQRMRVAPMDRRRELIAEFVLSLVATVLGHRTEAVSRTAGFAEMGMDSLASMELRTRLERALDCRLPTTLAFDYPNIESLSSHLINHVLNIPIEENTSRPKVNRYDTGDLDGLSRDEIAELLAGELNASAEGRTP